jgi:hypothetical protein
MTVRIFFAVMIILWPVLGFGPVPVPVLLLGALLAYDGAQSRTWAWVLVLVFTEIVYSMDLGVGSLAYATTTALFAMAGHWLALRPMAKENGWSPKVLLHGLLAAGMASAIILALSVSVGSVVHGQGSFMTRLSLQFDVGGWLLLWPVVIILALTMLKRSDEPFKKSIVFGP